MSGFVEFLGLFLCEPRVREKKGAFCIRMMIFPVSFAVSTGEFVSVTAKKCLIDAKCQESGFPGDVVLLMCEHNLIPEIFVFSFAEWQTLHHRVAGLDPVEVVAEDVGDAEGAGDVAEDVARRIKRNGFQ